VRAFSALVVVAAVALALLACGESLTVNNGDPSKDGGGSATDDGGAADGSSSSPLDAGDGGSSSTTETCKLVHVAPYGAVDSTFVSEPLLPKGPIGGGHHAQGLAIFSDGRLAVAGESTFRCVGGGPGPQTTLSILKPNGDGQGTLSDSTCPTSAQNASDFMRGITTSTRSGGRYYLLGRRGEQASLHGFNEAGAVTIQALMSDVRNPTANVEWTAYGAVADDDGRGVVIAGGDQESTPTRGYVERFVITAGVMAERELAFQNITREGVRGFRSIAAASFGYVVAGSLSLNNTTLVIKFGKNGQRVPFGSANEAVGPAIGNVVAVAADGPDVVVVGTDVVTTRLLKLRSDGLPDSSFGTGGIAELPNFTVDEPIARGAVLLRGCDGKWIVGGRRNGNTAIARVDSKGIIDSTFGQNGYAVIVSGPAGVNYTVTGMAIDANERLVTVSTALNASQYILHRLSL
jgi:hypothetical protein